MSDRNPWTDIEDGLLRTYIADGVSPCAAANRLSRPESSVYRRIESLSLKVKKQQRACLCCRRPFMSDGAHNRLCSSCRSKDKTPFDF